jgi:hypothetical protein
MPTFLTNAKMSPELTARIESSVTGRRIRPGDRLGPRFRALFRVTLALFAISLAVLFWISRRRENLALERDRAALLESVRLSSGESTAPFEASLANDETWILQLAGSYEGDIESPIAPLIAQPAIYVHGGVDEFATLQRVKKSSTVKDTVLHCLFDPPASRSEKAVLSKTRIAYGGGVEQVTPNVRTLDEAELGLPFMLPPFSDRVRAAKDDRDLAVLKKDFDKVSLANAKRALEATLLIVVLDERGTGPADIDGERAHDIRLALVDLRQSKVVFRTRKHVNPSEWSVTARAEYASGLDQCAFAFDILNPR